MSANDVAAKTTNPVGENRIGIVGGDTQVIKVPLAVNLAAYVAGNNVGGIIDLGAVLRLAGGTAVPLSVLVVEVGTQKAPLDILLFDAQPADNIADHAAVPALTLATALTIIGRASIAAADYVTVGGISTALASFNAQAVKAAAASPHLWAVINTSGTPTFSAATSLNLVVTFSRD